MPYFLYQPYAILLITAAGLSTALVFTVLKHRPNIGTHSFAVLMGAVAMWAFLTLFEVTAQDLGTKTLSGSLKYIFIVIVPVAFFVFALYYSNRLRNLQRTHLAILLALPLTTLVMVATNGHHQLMFKSMSLFQHTDLILISRSFGPWFWIHTTYSYALLLLGFVFLAKSLIDSPRLYRSQIIAMIVAVLFPWICNVLFLLGTHPLPHLDLTPFAFSISGLAVMWGILRYRLLDVVPIARDVVIQNMSDALFVLDIDHRIMDLNAAALTLMGQRAEEIIGQPARQAISWWPQKSGQRNPLESVGLPPVVNVGRENNIQRMQVTESVLRQKKKPIGHLILLRDITEESRLQEQLLQSQKMEAIGTLAGGIAHDFNNLLMGMQANLSMLQIGNEPVGTNQEKLKRIEDQIQSGAALTRQLLGYARKGKYMIATIDMHHLIKDTLHVIQRTNKSISTRADLRATSALVAADRGQMELMLLNLFVNAVDAMPHGGDLKVTSRMVRHEESIDSRRALKPVHYLEIKVTDTGVGIDQPTLDRIFEPFFTTKDIGRGTGLGLASVYSVVKKHKGRIRVSSKIGKGTTFTLLLPTTQKSITAPNHSPAPLSTVPSNGKQILIVDDEAPILSLIGGMVQSLGYTPLLAEGGQKAVRLYKDRHATIDLVILDMIMPKMDGRDVFEALRAINPQLKVIVASGFGPSARLEAILKQGSHLLLKKPFTRNALCEAMDRLLAVESDMCRTAAAAPDARADTLIHG